MKYKKNKSGEIIEFRCVFDSASDYDKTPEDATYICSKSESYAFISSDGSYFFKVRTGNRKRKITTWYKVMFRDREQLHDNDKIYKLWNGEV